MGFREFEFMAFSNCCGFICRSKVFWQPETNKKVTDKIKAILANSSVLLFVLLIFILINLKGDGRIFNRMKLFFVNGIELYLGVKK